MELAANEMVGLVGLGKLIRPAVAGVGVTEEIWYSIDGPHVLQELSVAAVNERSVAEVAVKTKFWLLPLMLLSRLNVRLAESAQFL